LKIVFDVGDDIGIGCLDTLRNLVLGLVDIKNGFIELLLGLILVTLEILLQPFKVFVSYLVLLPDVNNLFENGLRVRKFDHYLLHFSFELQFHLLDVIDGFL
jgi:hypothetical protein